MYVSFAFLWGVGVVLVVVRSIWSVCVFSAFCGRSGWCRCRSEGCGGCAFSLYSGVMLVFTVIAVASERRDHDDDDEKHDANDNNDGENCTDGSA